jgi:hypothetical protein
MPTSFENSLKQQLPQRELPEAREEMERAYANSGVEINPIVEIAKLGKVIYDSTDTFAVKKEDRTKYLNLLSQEEKIDLVIKVKEAISSQGYEETNDNVIAGLDEQIIKDKNLHTKFSDFRYALFEPQIEKFIDKINQLNLQDDTSKNLAGIIAKSFKEKNSEKLKLISETSLLSQINPNLQILTREAQSLAQEIEQPFKTGEQLIKTYFEENKDTIELTFEKALESAANNIDVIFDAIKYYENDPNILIIEGLAPNQKEDIFRLVLDQLKDVPDADEEIKKQTITKSIKLGLSALEAEKNRANN